MPLLKFDIIEGRTEQQVTDILDAAHRAVLRAFKVHNRDRYQIVTEHKAYQLSLRDTGLGFVRSERLVVVTVVTTARTENSKQVFYAELANQLQQFCGIAPSDLMVSIVTNTPADWSFGGGVAQYMNGEL